MVREFLRKTFRLSEPGSFDAAPIIYRNLRASIAAIKSKSIGSTGTEVYAGYFAEEYLTKLRGNKLAIEFDKFRRSDPQAKMLLLSVKNPICKATWEIEAASDDPLDKDIAALIEHIIFHDLGRSFPKKLREILSFVDFGHAVIEKTFKLVENHPDFGTYHGIKSLDLVSAKTIEQWVVDKDTKKLSQITQQANGDLQNNASIPIPAEYLMVFTLDQEGSNYEGISWLRPCYGNWFLKNLYKKLNGIGIEKFAVPSPIVHFTQGVQNDPQFDLILEALTLYTSGEANYMTIPKGFDVTFERNVYDPEKVEKSIDAEDRRMTKAFLANFLELGTGGNGGAFALSTDLSDFFLSGLTFVADEVADVFNENLIPELVKYNFGPQHKYPKLKHSGIDDKAGKELAEVYKTFVETKLITPSDQDEISLRKRYGLGKMPTEGLREYNPAPAAPQPGSMTLSERIRKKLYG